MLNKKFIKWQLIGLILSFGLFFVCDAQAASLVLGAAGAVIGSFFGPVGAQVGWMIGAMAGNLLFPQKGKNQEGPRLNDLHVQTNTNGMPIPDCWGTVCVAGNIIWCPGLQEHKHEEKQGGKGGGGGPTYTSYTYSASFAVALCAGEIYAIRRVFANTKLVYDASTGNEGGTGEFRKYMRIYKGTEEQMPDPLIQQFQKAQTPAFRGLSYVVIQDLPLENYGNQIPTLKFELIRTPDDVGNDSYGIKYCNRVVDGVSYDWGRITKNNGNNYLYRASNGINNTGGLLIQKINPNTYVVEKSKVGPRAFSAGVYPNLESLSSGTMMYWNYGEPGRLYDLIIYGVNPDTLSVSKTYPVDHCYKDDKGEWYGPYAQLMKYNVKLFSSIFTPPNSSSSLYIDTNLGGDGKKIYHGHWDLNSATANEIILNPNRCYFKGYTISGRADGSLFYLTAESAQTSNRTVYLNDTKNGFDLVKLHDYVSEPRFVNFGSMYYDQATDKLFITKIYQDNNDVNLIKINCKTWAIEKILELKSLTNPIVSYARNFGVDSENRKLILSMCPYYSSDDSYQFVLIDIDTMNIVRKVMKKSRVDNGQLWVDDIPCYNKETDHYIYNQAGGDVNNWGYIVNRGNRYDFGTYPLPDVVKELCIRTGMPSSKIDTSDLNGIAVKGYVRANRTTCRSMLEMLSVIYNFDAVESCGIVKFIKRGKDTVASINYDELGAKIYSVTSPSQDIFKSQRTQEIDLPKLANILYYDREKDYEQNSQESRRIIDTTENVYTLETPAVLVPNEAKQIIDRVMYQTWTARDKYQFTTNMDYASIEPTDVIKINKNDMSYTLRITKKDESQGICKFEAEAEDKTVYDQNGQGDGGLKPDQNITVISDTGLILLDIPIFDAVDNNSGIYAIFDKTNPKGSWRGAVVAKSTTSTGNFTEQDGSGSYATAGGVLGILADWDGRNIINYADSVDIQLNNGELEGVTEDDLINGANLCVIGNEVLQFKEADLIADKTYRLSGLLRARFGTEQWATNHNESEYFALLEFNQSKILRINKNDSMFGAEKYYKAVTLGKKYSDAPTIPFTSNGNGYRPYSINNFEYNKEEDGTINADWGYRGRGQVKFDDTIPVDIDGDLNFEIDILDDNSNIVRTIQTKINNFTYTAEQQIEDFGIIPDKINLSIYRVNGIIGRGFEFRTSI